MTPQSPALQLSDAQNRVLGDVIVDRLEGNLVYGWFTPAPAYAAVEGLFQEFIELANDQLFSHLDEVDKAIDALGLRLKGGRGLCFPTIYDVQIGGGDITFRFRPGTGDAGLLVPSSRKQSAVASPLSEPAAPDTACP